MITSTDGALKACKEVTKTLHRTTIADLVVPQYKFFVETEIEDPSPVHCMTMPCASGVDTFLACETVTDCAPGVPSIVGQRWKVLVVFSRVSEVGVDHLLDL